MATVRQRRKTKNPNTKVRQRNRIVKETVILEPTLERHWDRSKTLEQNFRTVGLANRINKDISKRMTQKRLQEWNWKRREMVKKGELEGYDSEEEIFTELEGIFAKGEVTHQTDVVTELEEKANETASKSVPRIRQLSEYEQAYITRLVTKYGDDYDRMFMDIKLNERQLTANQLRKLAEKR